MNLLDTLQAAGLLASPPDEETRAALDMVQHVTEDSRRVRPGSLFVAVSGTRTDGHDYASQAAAAGAVLIAGERPRTRRLDGLPYLHVSHARWAGGLCAHALRGNPARAMTVIGVTGTNGKSSTVALIDAILRASDKRTAVFGTLGYVIAGESKGQEHTTPFAEDLAALFDEAAAAGVTHVTMEVSSHALHQRRVAGIPFTVAAFTNLTQDHLDYHGTMEAYRDAKAMLFTGLDASHGTAVVNLDDPHGAYYRQAAPCRTIPYGKGAACRADDVRMTMQYTAFNLITPWGEAPLRLPLLGMHNVSNALCAAAAAGAAGASLEAIVSGLEGLPSVPGRFEAVGEGRDFQVVVDYAHTDDGLRNVLEAARALCAGKIITVFGCGGDRDKTKRPKMGKVAGSMSDFCILTSDNPRTEDPYRILLDAEVGLQQAGRRKGTDYEVIEDRATAIETAIRRAAPGDLVLIAGKGHEDYQIIGTEKIHFDDREVAREVLRRMA